ncbi:LamG domain-containing protein [Roseivirga misakiensis]|uniref:DUF8202 domain-containing protein n=1 Tax=Roseivirga misakiensis TaxID=1563681 RepID=A0A1E5T656_9BACT|nr:hypothetical protein [Roseivirga misakiensis]OEK06855.1 hypothetical protein BFP71_04145 [Roseivirga misakiensis]
MALTLGLCENLYAQSDITTINTTTVSGTATSNLNVEIPSDAGNSLADDAGEEITVNYGVGNNIKVSSYIVGGVTYDRFLAPDTLVLNRALSTDRLVNIWFTLNSTLVDNTPPTDDIANLDADEVEDADAIYLSGNLNAGYDNILVNIDDAASGSIEVETERVDVVWYSGIQTSDPTTAVFPVIERGGNDNIAIAAITSLNSDGTPASYGTLIGISENDWPGTGSTFNNYLILRRETSGSTPLPLLNIGTDVFQTAQTIQGVAVSFTELGISANQSIFGYSIFPADVVNGYVSNAGNAVTSGAVTVAAGVDLTDISTFPNDTRSNDSGLDLVAGVSAAVASDDNLIETVGPGGYKANNVLRTWLKANDGAFVSNGGAASTEGGSVGFWEDQSVADNDYTTLGTAPTFRSSTSSINFNPTVDFLTGSDTGLQTPDSDDYNINGPFTRKSINIAFRTSTTDVTTRQQIFEEGGGGNGLGIYIDGGTLYGAVWNRNNDTSAGAPWNNGTPTSFVSTSIAIDTEYILTLEFDGSTDFTGTVTLFLNGQSFGSLSSVGILYNHGNDIGLGDQDGGSRYHNNTTDADSYQGEIAEFIYCNDPAALTTAGRNRIESYLAIKYGITLDQSTPINYVNSAGDIIFNTTSSAAIGGYLEYNNDIAGIGRDDDSELDQPASRSENAGSVVTIDRGASISTDDTWLIWGNDGGALTESSSVTSPSTIDTRLERVWRVAEENEVLTTSVSFDITGLGLSTNPDDFSLLVASNSSNGDFSNATVLTGGTLVGNTLTFTGVDLEDGEYFTLGTAFFFCTPGNYNDGILMWLRADEGVTTATEGANVTIWDDQTPSNNDAVVLTAPIYRATTNLVNFNPTIDFNTGSTGLFIANVGGFNADESTSKKFTIAFRTGDDITTQQVIYEQGGATRGINLYIQSGVLHLSAWNQASDGIGAPWNTAGAIATVNTSSIAVNTDYIVTFDYAGNDAITGTVTGYLNGASFGTPLSNVGRLYPHTDPIGLGDENSASRYGDGTTSGASSFVGFISEMSFYNEPSSYSAADRNRIESSMAIKYGITLDQTSATDFTSSDGIAIWDASVNPGYDVNIAGIGRDDDACLEQKQSRSGNDDAIVTVGLGEIAATNDANSNSFDDDGDFFTWGSDGASTDFANITTAGTPGTVTDRMLRVWKAQDTGDVGATDISFDLTSLPGYSGNAGDYQLIIANGGDNTSLENGTTITGGTFNGGVLTFSGVDLTDGQFFTLGVASEFCAPGGVTSSMVLWLRPDQGTSTLVDNTTLTTWTDQSTASNNAIDDGNPPLYRDNTTDNINFQPTMEFDGSNDRLSLGDLSEIKSASGTGQYSMFGVGLRDDGSTNYVLGSTGGTTNQDLHFGYRNSTNATIAHWGNDLDVPVNAFNSPNTPFLVGATYTSGDRVVEELRSDDFNRATDGNTTPISGTQTNYVGDLVSVGSYDGFISEVLVYNREVTDLEKLRIYSYFSIKYGITVPQDNNNNTTLNESIGVGSVQEGDLVASNETTIIWDESNGNSTYHNGMAGIGRDDAACLNQKQSTSASDGTILTIGLDAIATNNASNSGIHDDLDFLVWGHDGVATNQATAAGDLSDLPSTVSERMRRVWRVEDTGTVGETEIQFDLTGLNYSSDAADFRLIIADAGSGGTMAGGTLVAGGTFNGDVLSFSGINLTDGQYFTLGTALETCGPGGVNTNIALWLRGDLEAFSDAGSTAATDGDNVLQWNDQSSPADNGSESNLGGGGPIEPTFEANEINFNPALRFVDPNSNNASYIETSSNTVSGDMTLISVFKTGQAAGTAGDFVNSPALIGASETGSTFDYGLGMENGTIWVNANTSTGFDAETATTFNNNSPHFVTATRTQSSGAITVFVDGNSEATGTGSTSALTAPSSFGIGNHSDGDVDAQFAGDIAESIVFSSVLSSEERNRVESYLALKYGLTMNASDNGATGGVDERDYRAADGDVIWDFDGQGTTYYNDIFGIGRDDLSCLSQTSSKSENSDALVTFTQPGGVFNNNDAFIVSGNDNAAIENSDNREFDGAQVQSRLNREWRVQETGTLGDIEVTFDLTSITGPLGVGTNNLTQLRLMVDDDGDFSNGGTTYISPSAIDGGGNTATFTVNFTNGQYYTLGSIEVAALPITLLSFEAEVNEQGQVQLDWVTASEVNNAFYTIENSTDGVNFNEVANIDGAGNSDAVLFYTYTHTKPANGLSFYRLKQTDFSGEFEYSEIRSVRVESQFEATYKAYPNPIRKGETLRIAYQVQEDKELQLILLNRTGKVLRKEVHTALARNEYLEVSTTGFNAGLNLIRIIDQTGNTTTLKVIVR